MSPSRHQLVAFDSIVRLEFAKADEDTMDSVPIIRSHLVATERILRPAVDQNVAFGAATPMYPGRPTLSVGAPRSQGTPWRIEPLNLVSGGFRADDRNRIDGRLPGRSRVARQGRQGRQAAFMLSEVALQTCSILLSGGLNLDGIDLRRASSGPEAADGNLPVDAARGTPCGDPCRASQGPDIGAGDHRVVAMVRGSPGTQRPS